MNLPRAYARGFTLFKQPNCLPRILRPLVLYVRSDYFLVDAHRGYKVACDHRLSVPQYTFLRNSNCFFTFLEL